MTDTAPTASVPEERAIGDWLLTCTASNETKAQQCSIGQRLVDGKSKSSVFLWRIVRNADGNFYAVWETPTGVMVNRGILLDIGNNKPIAIPYQSCVAGKCEATANLEPGYLDMLARSRKATATVYPVSGQPITLNLSIKGLAEGLAALKSTN